jgi:hypothetical protein
MTTDEIKPAIEAEDLRDMDHARLSHGISDDATIAHRQMALANSALPDDDPRKITRADVDHIEWTVEQMRKLNPISIDDEAKLSRIADKLAALLPPTA